VFANTLVDVRASRLVSMLLLLQTRGSMTAAALAEELEVSVRTVYRDMEALGAAGVPVYAEPGRNGGCRLVEGYRTRLTGLTEQEADALFLGGLPDAVGQLGLGTVLAAAQLKMLAALPPELRSRATRVRERFHLDAPAWFQLTDDVPCLAELAQAAWEDRRVRVTYQRGDGHVTRLLDPMGLVLKGGVWYLVARHRGQLRTYRVSRITQLASTGERFERPDDFDLADHWADASLAFEESLLLVEVKARVRVGALSLLRRALEPAAARSALSVAPTPSTDGWFDVTIPGEMLDYLYIQLLQLGADIEVLEPADLRERMAHTGAALTALYS
jgi:predicted DNA-binding transcriptional regulator YafY